MRRTILLVAAAVAASGAAAASLRPAGETVAPPVANVFTTPLRDDAPLAPESAASARSLAAQARYTPDSTPVAGFYPTGYNTVIKESDFSVPVYTVPEDQPTTRVVWVDGDRRPHPPGVASDLQTTFDEVPLPLDVDQLQADGSDGHLVIHQPSTDTLWEFWTFAAVDAGGGVTRYEAGYGARIEQWSRSTGALPNQWGARATSLDLLGGVMRMQDYIDGAFPYALTMSVPVIDDVAVPPATRSDGPFSGTPSGDLRHAVSEGMKFRLPAGYDCDARTKKAPSLLRMICVAARDYGLVITDRAGGTVTLYAEDDRTVGTRYQSVDRSPWQEIGQHFGGPEAVLPDFPWEDLVQLAPFMPERA